MGTVRMTMAQALVRFLDNQYVCMDGCETKFVEGVAAIFGHGIVVGLGQALDENPGGLKVFQGKNEQGMAHMAASFAKQNKRRKIIACASSIGPGAANMITAAACATVNNIPLLVLPGDTFAIRQPDPVLQQVEQPNSLQTTTNDAFKPVCKYWDRVERPEQLMTAMINAMRVLTDPAEAGAVCVAVPQDVQGESYDYPDYFLRKRVHRIVRQSPAREELEDVASALMNSKRPLVICGGGVKYSEAGETLENFCERFNIPFAETQAGKSACRSSSPLCLGGVGVTGNLAANSIAWEADLILAVGSRLSDFTTSSKWLFRNPEVKVASINVSRFHAYKMDAVKAVGDAKAALEELTKLLSERKYRSSYGNEISVAKTEWNEEMKKLGSYSCRKDFQPMIAARNPGSMEEFAKMTGCALTQTAAICAVRKHIAEDAILVGASGSLPGDLQRMWTTDARDSYNMEYGYSCMGYEIAGALGAKLARPDREVYAVAGDGSFLMLHTELLTSIQEHQKINVLLFDNASFGCINNLQMSNGVGNLGTEFRFRDSGTGGLTGALIPVNYAAVAAGYGAKTYSVRNMDELEEALEDSKKQNVSTLIDLKVLPKTMTHDYLSWWHVGLASTAENEAEREAFENKEAHRAQARKY
ncbi:3D-(3,5/4)-trihydroxycyclohexane-1,2-dione hydrolase [Caprobacter fermentans]|uniref:3D-(3,5/4)-trihydroxycyclohexane-1,2-dione acylhydrolase (Decyclizing) n=1 Tax=Caproicibacter fermentans TaxID=2576756 RepID=A0A6N8HXE2_9FIRM|nr:3D-(3,5/4)-trihydroxycyclohexane-1,2-dione acylhydrolase (decyclizing) [Caproicibacter fermentans]MVB10167.1 3D-(3,5/4)-trihydroxycyclohexane-1,2-dione hydrolase [Caproicibacter fermentans]QNK41758.1 3D-(3,5/4)-trihydroxycyclohexane-1,2-dione acylhydrolase (decyclizing) [Caproicibacter fermentans]